MSFKLNAIDADVKSSKELLRENTYGRSWMDEIYAGVNTWNTIMDRKKDREWIQEQRINIKEGYTSNAFDTIVDFVNSQPDDIESYKFALERFHAIANSTKVRDPNSPLITKAMTIKRQLNREMGELSEVEDIKRGIQSKNDSAYSEWAFINVPPAPGWESGDGPGSTEQLISQGLEYYDQFSDRLTTMNRYRGEIKIDIEEEKKFLENLKSYLGKDGMIDSNDFQNAREGLTLTKVYDRRMDDAQNLTNQIDQYERELGKLENKISLWNADRSAFSEMYSDDTPTTMDENRLTSLPSVINKLKADKSVLDEWLARKRFDATGLKSETFNEDTIDLDDPLAYNERMTEDKYLGTGRKQPFSAGQTVEFKIGEKGETYRGKVKTFHPATNWKDEMVTLIQDNGIEKRVLVRDIKGATVGTRGKAQKVENYSGMRLLSGQAEHGIEDILSKGLIEEIESEANLGVSLDDYVGGIDLNTGMIYAESGEAVYSGGDIKETEIGTRTVGEPTDLWKGFGTLYQGTFGRSLEWGGDEKYTPKLHSDEHQQLAFDELFKAMKDGGLQPVKLSPKILNKIRKEVGHSDLLKEYNKDLTNVSFQGESADISEDSSLARLNNGELDISSLPKAKQNKVILFAKDYNKLIEDYNSADTKQQNKLRKRFVQYDKHLNKLLK